MKASFEEAVEINKKKIIACVVLWLILTIILISPFAYSLVNATAEGTFNFGIFLETMIELAPKPFSTFFKIFSGKYFLTFIKVLIVYSIIFFLCFLKGFSKTKSRGEYHDIEHGSSDWSKKGEQYKVLSENEGILLAKENYLPLDKRGNINVLVVGRFWFW